MDGISKGTWQRIALCKVLQERNEKNVNGRTICSVSVSQGVVNQVEYLGRSFAAKQTSHYNIVNIYKKVKDPNMVGALSGHKEGSRAFARYRNIDDDMKKEMIGYLD